MENLSKLQKTLKKQGKLDAVQKLAGSEDAAKLASQLPKDGDPETMKAALKQLLNTEAGRRLAQQVKDAMGNG